MLQWNAAALLAQQETEPLLEQLDPPRRAMVLMAILGLVLLGMLMVACVMIAGRWVRREARRRYGRSAAGLRKKIVTESRRLGELPDGSAGETIHIDLAKGETKAD